MSKEFARAEAVIKPTAVAITISLMEKEIYRRCGGGAPSVWDYSIVGTRSQEAVPLEAVMTIPVAATMD
jgi:hypothetical protein